MDNSTILFVSAMLQAIGISALMGGEVVDFVTEPAGGEAGMGRILLMGLLGLVGLAAVGIGLLGMSFASLSMSKRVMLSGSNDGMLREASES